MGLGLGAHGYFFFQAIPCTFEGPSSPGGIERSIEVAATKTEEGLYERLGAGYSP